MENFEKISSAILLFVLILSLFLNIRGCAKIDKDKYKILENTNKNLQCSRDSLIKINKSLQIDVNVLQDSINKRTKIINGLKNDLIESDFKLDKANKQVYILEKEKRDTDRKIEDLLKNPIRRVDDDLINSLKNKVRQ
jgi:septal ring factor EnvC (AmiA/AmiB activator)